MTSLAEAYPIEQARCRELLKIYQEIPTGVFGAAMIEATLKEAEEAVAMQDLVRMIVAFKRMQEHE